MGGQDELLTGGWVKDDVLEIVGLDDVCELGCTQLQEEALMVTGTQIEIEVVEESVELGVQSLVMKIVDGLQVEDCVMVFEESEDVGEQELA